METLLVIGAVVAPCTAFLLAAGVWPFAVPPKGSDGHTEALEASLEAWHDAYDQVFDYDDPDSTIFQALAAADATQVPSADYWPECPTCHGQMVHGVCDLCAHQPTGIMLSRAEKAARLPNAFHVTYACPSCRVVSVTPENRCPQCGYKEPGCHVCGWPCEADMCVQCHSEIVARQFLADDLSTTYVHDLSRWNADTQSFEQKRMSPFQEPRMRKRA